MFIKKTLVFLLIISCCRVVASESLQGGLNKQNLSNVINNAINTLSVYRENIGNEVEVYDQLIGKIEANLEFIRLENKNIELSRDLLTDLYIEVKDIKDVLFVEFNDDGTLRNNITKMAQRMQERLSGDSKLVKVLLSNGKHLPLVQYKVSRNDTLRIILTTTYPNGYSPSWVEISTRIKTIVKINDSIENMDAISPNQIIYIPLFSDKDKDDLASKIIENKKDAVINAILGED